MVPCNRHVVPSPTRVVAAVAIPMAVVVDDSGVAQNRPQLIGVEALRARPLLAVSYLATFIAQHHRMLNAFSIWCS